MGAIEKKQYNLLNALKIIAAFFVVAIHIHFPGDFGKGVIAVARFAVPFFFMVSGFFSFYENRAVLNEKYKRKIKHLLLLFGTSLLLYFAYGVLGSIMNGTLEGYLKSIFSVSSFFELFVFNHVRIMEALWFLPALIYVYLVFLAFEKTGITKKLYFLIPVLFLAGTLFRECIEIFPEYPAIMSKAYLYRNFLFVGLPFFMLGHYIKANEEKLKNKFSNTLLFVLMIIGTAESVAVELLHTGKSVYIGTFVAVFALFLFAVKNEEKYSAVHLANAGAKYSLYVYILHIMVSNVFSVAGRIVPAVEKVIDVLEPVYPIVIFAISLAISAIYVFIKNTIKQKIKKQEK